MTLAPNGKDYVCDLEGDDTCACSTTLDCQCIPEPVCDGPLVGTLVGLEVECADCGSPMVEVGGATAGEAKPTFDETLAQATAALPGNHPSFCRCPFPRNACPGCGLDCDACERARP